MYYVATANNESILCLLYLPLLKLYCALPAEENTKQSRGWSSHCVNRPQECGNVWLCNLFHKGKGPPADLGPRFWNSPRLWWNPARWVVSVWLLVVTAPRVTGKPGRGECATAQDCAHLSRRASWEASHSGSAWGSLHSHMASGRKGNFFAGSSAIRFGSLGSATWNYA